MTKRLLHRLRKLVKNTYLLLLDCAKAASYAKQR